MDLPAAIERPAIPYTSLKVLHRLGATLLRDQPNKSSPAVESSAFKLAAMLIEVRAALISRMREYNPRQLAAETEFDRAVDVNWVTLRKLLEGYRDAFGHPGLDALPVEVQQKLDLPKLRHKAALATTLHERLFGPDGTGWVSSGWVVQAETMATILGLIDSDGLTSDLEQVVGSDIVRLLEAVQPVYEGIADARMIRDNTRTDDFQTLRARLRWQLEHYRNAVETLRELDDPSSFELVDRALRALVLLSKRTHGGTITDELLDEEDFEAFDAGEDSDDSGEPQQPALLAPAP